MSSIANTPTKPDVKRLDIFGPQGLRELLRTILKITQANLAGKYAVHELLSPGDAPYPCGQSDLHPNEAPGADVRQSDGEFWPNIENEAGWVISAGPIKHRGVYNIFLWEFLTPWHPHVEVCAITAG
jgi:hypothetical protein